MQILAACHVHSAWSYDGSWTLEALRDTFAERGYRALLMTEHDRGFTEARWAEYRNACAHVTNDQVLVVPGIEYSDGDNCVHVLVWGNVPFLGENLPTDQMLGAVGGHDGVAVLAHPTRRGAWERVKPEWTPLLTGIEVWNRKYDGWAPGTRGTELVKQFERVPFVGLDFHTAKQQFPLGMALEVSGSLTEATIVESLRRHRCNARAFGLALDEKRLVRRLHLLRLAEEGRRRLARVKRFSMELAG